MRHGRPTIRRLETLNSELSFYLPRLLYSDGIKEAWASSAGTTNYDLSPFAISRKRVYETFGSEMLPRTAHLSSSTLATVYCCVCLSRCDREVSALAPVKINTKIYNLLISLCITINSNGVVSVTPHCGSIGSYVGEELLRHVLLYGTHAILPLKLPHRGSFSLGNRNEVVQRRSRLWGEIAGEAAKNAKVHCELSNHLTFKTKDVCDELRQVNASAPQCTSAGSLSSRSGTKCKKRSQQIHGVPSYFFFLNVPDTSVYLRTCGSLR